MAQILLGGNPRLPSLAQVPGTVTKQHTPKVHYFIGGSSVACGTTKVEMATSDTAKVRCRSCRRVAGIPTHKSEHQKWLDSGR